MATHGKAANMSAIVKKVEGNAVHVYTSSGDNPTERILYLACLQIPRCVSSAASEEPDEPYGFAARELMRKCVVAEKVSLIRFYCANGKDYGTVVLPDTQTVAESKKQVAEISNGKDVKTVSELLLLNGFAKFSEKGVPGAPSDNEFLTNLRECDQIAQKKQLGLWSPSAGSGRPVRKIIFSLQNEHFMKKFVEDHKGTKIRGIVEAVKGCGNEFDIYFPDFTLLTSVSLTGLEFESYGQSDKLEPFAAYVKSFVEKRLLQWDIQVRIERFNKSWSINGSIYRDDRNISERLLELGLARIDEKTVSFTEAPASLRNTLRTAQMKKLGKWADMPVTTAQDLDTYVAKVVEVHSGDSLTVRPISTGYAAAERRLNLANIRCPRVGNRFRPDEPCAYEAKELLRSKCVGKRVTVALQYTRDPLPTATGPPPAGADPTGKMFFVNITVEGHDAPISEALVRAGLARTVRPRGDEICSDNFQTLVDLEAEAAADRVGLRGPQANAKPTTVVDLVGNADLAASYESDLKRRPHLEGVIEHCFNAGMYKIRVPKDRIAVKFALAGIKVPVSARNRDEVSEPFAKEADEWARESLMQRFVSFTVEGCERSGTFFGSLFLAKDNINERLISIGLATVLEGTWTRAKTSLKPQLMKAEVEAKNQRVGLWSSDNAVMENSAASPNEGAAARPEVPTSLVVHVASFYDFYIQRFDNELDTLQSEFRMTINEAERFSAGIQPRRGDVVLANFSADGEWYRGLILKYTPATAEAEVRFLDYGNQEAVSLQNMRRCRAEYVKRLPPQSMRCQLAGIKCPTENLDDAGEYLHRLTADHLLHGRIERTLPAADAAGGGVLSGWADKKHEVVLWRHDCPSDTRDPSASDTSSDEAIISINERIVMDGIAYVHRKSTTAIKPRLTAAQAVVKKARKGIWCHGDVQLDSDDEF